MDIKTEKTLSSGATISYGIKKVNEDPLEVDMFLVWDTPEKQFVYYIGGGHAGYSDVDIQLDDTATIVRVVARSSPKSAWHDIAMLNTDTGEFHGEGDLRFSRPDNAWAMLHQRDGIIFEDQLTWSMDNQTQDEYLYDSYLQSRWQWHKDAGWVLTQGDLPSVSFPSPSVPYKMKMTTER